MRRTCLALDSGEKYPNEVSGGFAGGAFPLFMSFKEVATTSDFGFAMSSKIIVMVIRSVAVCRGDGEIFAGERRRVRAQAGREVQQRANEEYSKM